MSSTVASPSTGSLPPSPPQQGGRRPWARILLWLILAVLLGMATLIVWTKIKRLQPKDRVPAVAVNQEPKMATMQELLSRFTPDLGFSTDTVPPLDPNRKGSIAARHSPEFRDNKFLEAQRNNWTLQVMNVTRESVVVDYLSKRSDRSQFHYFQYVDSDKQTHFILTYGVYGSMNQAMDDLNRVSFDLPGSVRAFPERLRNYLPLAARNTSNDGKLEESQDRPRRVILKPVRVPEEDPAQMPYSRRPQTERNNTEREQRRTNNDNNNEERPRRNREESDSSSERTSRPRSETRETSSEPPPTRAEREAVRETVDEGAPRELAPSSEQPPPMDGGGL